MATKTDVRIKINYDLKEPSKYQVIYINDDKTTYDFVIGSLVEIFRLDPDTATDLTIRVHEEGSAVVAVLPYELAEQKSQEVMTLARNSGFPLTLEIKEDI